MPLHALPQVTLSRRLVLLATLMLLSGWTITVSAVAPLVPIPTVTTTPYERSADPADRNVPFLAWYEDLAPQGYLEEEILMSGTANVYEYVDEVNQTPEPQATGVSGPYTTRVLIRRPENAADFNGVVYLEILNATARYDGAPIWDLAHRSIIAEGAAWVGVTYSDITAAFMRDTWGTTTAPAPANAEPRNRSRYATLNLPTRKYTWDILNQAAALLREDTNPANPMQGFGVNVIIAGGYSQSAAYVTTFANSFYPSYSEVAPCTIELAAADGCTPLVDGYLVAAGGPTSRLLDGAGSNPLGNKRNCENALNRESPCVESSVEPVDSNPYQHQLPKVVRFTTESDIKAARVRQTMADQPLLRTYEVAGTSHVGYWPTLQGQKLAEYSFGVPATGEVNSPCVLPFNPVRTGIPMSAIMVRLARWIEFDETPPPSHYMEWQGDFDAFDANFRPLVSWVRDDGDNDATDGDYGRGDGNAIGGVRPPRLMTPLGQYYGSNFFEGNDGTLAPIFCRGIYGGFDAYTHEELQARYFNKNTFVVYTWWNMWLAYIDGFLLVTDAKVILDEAKAFDGLPE